MYNTSKFYQPSPILSLSHIKNYGNRKKKIGGGTYGEVYRYDKGNHSYAIKILKEDDNDDSDVENEIFNDFGITLREIASLLYLNHPNIINLIDIVYEIGMVMPLGISSLRNYTNLNNDQIHEITYQMCCAVAYIHSKSVMHRDIKPDNFILFSGGNNELFIKLGDFGASRIFSCLNIDFNAPAFTYSYAPLEVLIDDEYYFPADVWSLGCVIYELHGKSPIIKEDTKLKAIRKLFNFLGNPGKEQLSKGARKYEEEMRKLPVHPPLFPNPIEDIYWEELLVSIFRYDSASRPTAFDLVISPIFDDIRDKELEYSTLPCIDSLRGRERYPKQILKFKLFDTLREQMLTYTNSFDREFFAALYYLDAVFMVTEVTMWKEAVLTGFGCLFIAHSMYRTDEIFKKTLDDYYSSYFVSKFASKDEFKDKIKEIPKILGYDLAIITIYDFGLEKSEFTNKKWRINVYFMLVMAMSKLRFKYLQEELYDISEHLTRRYFDPEYKIPIEYFSDVKTILSATKILDTIHVSSILKIKDTDEIIKKLKL
jgi:serine/threonine protein kinase